MPLAWLGYLFLLFTLFYAAYFMELLELDTARILPLSLHFSIKQIIRPFGVFAPSSIFLSFLGKHHLQASCIPAPHHLGHASIHFKSRAPAPQRPRCALALQDRVRNRGRCGMSRREDFFPKPGTRYSHSPLEGVVEKSGPGSERVPFVLHGHRIDFTLSSRRRRRIEGRSPSTRSRCAPALPRYGARARLLGMREE